jgi:hypothetical protein
MTDTTCLGIFITQACNGKESLRDGRIVDFDDPSGSPALVRQILFETVARHPSRTGEPVQITVDVETGADGEFRVRLDCWDKARRPALLTSTAMPLKSFTWMVAETAKALEKEPGCKLRLGALRRDSPLVRAMLACEGQEDDLVLTEQKAVVSLPAGDLFTTEPTGPRRSLKRRGTWLKAVFTPETFAELQEAASQPGLQTEVGFFGSVRVHLAGDSTCQVVIERLHQSPAEAGPVSMRISGACVYQMYHRVERLGAWIHTHPAEVEGVALSPTPSAADIGVAVQVSALAGVPAVFPIAMSPLAAAGDVDAFGFVNNLFCPLDLEVLT